MATYQIHIPPPHPTTTCSTLLHIPLHFTSHTTPNILYHTPFHITLHYASKYHHLTPQPNSPFTSNHPAPCQITFTNITFHSTLHCTSHSSTPHFTHHTKPFHITPFHTTTFHMTYHSTILHSVRGFTPHPSSHHTPHFQPFCFTSHSIPHATFDVTFYTTQLFYTPFHTIVFYLPAITPHHIPFHTTQSCFT